MKFGFNLLLWTPHITKEHLPILKALKLAGYDGVEVPMFEGTPEHYAWLGAELDRLGLARTSVSVLGAGQNPLSKNKAAPVHRLPNKHTAFCEGYESYGLPTASARCPAAGHRPETDPARPASGHIQTSGGRNVAP